MSKILFSINTLGVAGAETSLLNYLNTLDYSTDEVDLQLILPFGEWVSRVHPKVNILHKRKVYPPTSSTFQLLRHIAIRFIKSFPYIKSLSIILSDWFKLSTFSFDKVLWRFLASTAPSNSTTYDVAVAYIEGGATHYIGAYITARYKIAILHNHYTKSGYSRHLDGFAYFRFDKILCVSPETHASFLAEYPELESRTHLYRNPVDPQYIKAQALYTLPLRYSNTIQIVTVARLHAQKGLDLGLYAMKYLADKGYDFHWLIIGEGEEHTSLLSLRRKLDLVGYCSFIGKQSNPYTHIASADIYFQPSRFEGWGIALEEAVILERPIITTRTDGVASLLTHGENALVCEAFPYTMSEALESLILSPSLRQKLSNACKSVSFNICDGSTLTTLIKEGCSKIEDTNISTSSQ